MKKLLYPIALILTAFLILYSCSVEKELVNETTNQKVEIPLEDILPQVYINTNSQEIPDEPKIIAEISIENKGELRHEGFIGIEIRGQINILIL